MSSIRVLTVDVAVMGKVFSCLYGEGVAVTKKEEVICYTHDGFIHMVGDDYSFGGFMNLNKFLHHFHMLRSNIGEGFVKYAELRFRIQDEIHLGNPDFTT